MRKTLIRNGTIVTHKTTFRSDLLIQGEKIAELGDKLEARSDLEIDASGLLVLPGAVDSHVHFNDSFMNTVSVHDYYTGTLAAAHGGVTSVIDFSNQEKNQSLLRTIESKREEASGKALIDWGVHPVITDPSQRTLEEIPVVIENGAPTVKCYLTYRQEGLMIGFEDLGRILRVLQRNGGMLMVHAEDNDTLEASIPNFIDNGKWEPIYHAKSRPIEAENLAIIRLVELARQTSGKVFVVHLASSEGIDIIEAAQKEGLNVFAETCTHYLVFTEQMLERSDGIKWICSPPLRDKENQGGLWRGLHNGVLSMVTSDDAAYSWDAKLMGKDRFDLCPNGIPGIEPRVHLLYSEGVVKGRLTLERFVDLTSTGPARFFGLAPEKGDLNKGTDADVVLFDPNEEWIMNRDSLNMAVDWSAYEGIKIKGRIKKVFARGELIVDGDTCLAEKGRGRYLHRSLL